MIDALFDEVEAEMDAEEPQVRLPPMYPAQDTEIVDISDKD